MNSSKKDEGIMDQLTTKAVREALALHGMAHHTSEFLRFVKAASAPLTTFIAKTLTADEKETRTAIDGLVILADVFSAFFGAVSAARQDPALKDRIEKEEQVTKKQAEEFGRLMARDIGEMLKSMGITGEVSHIVVGPRESDDSAIRRFMAARRDKVDGPLGKNSAD